MNKEIKQKWVAALRSGEYKQTKKTLRKEDGFCCLGVLCDIYHKETKNGEWGFNTIDGEYIFKTDTNYSRGVLPIDVFEWSGLENENPDIVVDGKNIPIAVWNDGDGTFIEIADAIEKQF